MFAIFWGTVYDEVIPALSAYLMGKFRLTLEDSEDCISEALEGLAARQEEDPKKVGYPRRYIWQSAIYSAIDLIKERNKAADIQRKLLCEQLVNRGKHNHRVITSEATEISNRGGSDDRPLHEPCTPQCDTAMEDVPSITECPSQAAAQDNPAEPQEDNLMGGEVVGAFQDSPNEDISAESACCVIEGLFEDIEAEEPWAVTVVSEALTHLTPSERRVIEAVLMFGPDYDSRTAKNDIEISPTAFRQYKHRAYHRLREIIPKIMKDRGIAFRRHPETTSVISPRRSEFPSDDDE